MNTPVEYSANIRNFVSTVVVENWKNTGKRVKMNTSDYRPEHGDIVEGPTTPEPDMRKAPGPLKDPRIDAQGNVIANMGSPAHRV